MPAILLGVLIFLGQTSPAQSEHQNQEQSQKEAAKAVAFQDQNRAGEGARAAQAPTTPAQTPQEPAKPDSPVEKPEVKITPHEAEELFHSVDEILAFDSKQTGLRIKKQVKRKLTTREEVVDYISKHRNDEDTQRLRRSELVLKKFGLLPRDFDLEKLLVALLREQVAGYYDSKTKTVNLLDWVPVEEQEPVMAHELTHALQDQTVNLEKWMKRGEKDLAVIKKDPTPADIENDEIDDVRQAIVEGQAETVMLQYALAPVGRSVVDSPDLVDAMEQSMISGTPDSTVFKDAPIFLKESLTFPYSYGMEFVVKLMQKRGRDTAFAGVLHDPPRTTRQIMQPETYLSGEKIDPMPVPDFAHDFKAYQKFDIGAMGEFDVAVLIEQYGGKDSSRKLYPEWRGGYYYAARPNADAAAPLGLLYVSRWSSAEVAAEFSEIYAKSLRQRYKKVDETGAGSNETVASAAGGSVDASPQVPESNVTGVIERRTWATEEGTVVIDHHGDTVFVSESLDPDTTRQLEKEVFRK